MTDPATEAAERIADYITIYSEERDHIAAILRPYFADSQARAERAEKKLERVREEVEWLHSRAQVMGDLTYRRLLALLEEEPCKPAS